MKTTLLAASALSLAFAAPVFAQQAPASGQPSSATPPSSSQPSARDQAAKDQAEKDRAAAVGGRSDTSTTAPIEDKDGDGKPDKPKEEGKEPKPAQ